MPRKKYRFNEVTGRCEDYSRFGCKLNKDSFATLDQCEANCAASTPTASELSIAYKAPLCALPAQVTYLLLTCSLDTGHFFNTSLIQCLVFKGIVKGPESKIWAFFKGLRSFRGPQKQN